MFIINDIMEVGVEFWDSQFPDRASGVVRSVTEGKNGAKGLISTDIIVRMLRKI
jgi:hypothetical protein